MRIRLYGGAGHGRMVFLPASVAVAPPEICVPLWPIGQLEVLAPLDPDVQDASVGLRYRDTGLTDPDSYRRYEWIPTS